MLRPYAWALFFSSSLGSITLLLAMEDSARAQSQGGYALQRFDPAEKSSEWFTGESLDLRGKLRPAGGVVIDGQYRPLAVYDRGGTLVGSILRDVVTMHAGASLVLRDRFRIGASMPFYLFQQAGDGAPVTFDGVTYRLPPQQAIGDLRLGADVRIVGEYGGPIQVAAGLQVHVPTGDREWFTSDGTVRLAPRLMAAGDIGPFVYSARVGLMLNRWEGTFGSTQIGNEFTYGVTAGLRVLDKKLVFGPELWGSVGLASNPATLVQPNERAARPLEGLIGAHYTWRFLRLGAGVGTGLSRGIGSPQVRWLASLDVFPEIAEDTDGDGIKDVDDACPTVPGEKSFDPKKHGCPPDRDGDGTYDVDDACIDVPGPRENKGCPAEKDSDGDGILDRDDACPALPGVRTDDPKTNGCPPDKDGDGVFDQDDACIDVPGVPTQDRKTNGCPPDKDGDGIWDKDDACVDVPGVASSKPEFNGCPADLDGDTIPNEQDACPKEPGKPDPDPSKNGCPKAFVSGGTIKILDQVKFKTASAEIVKGKDSEEILAAVLKVLTDHPEIKKVSVEGHTDNQGSAAYNKKLSADRAASVVKWLVGKGVDKSRLTSAGFGMERPIDTNDTEAGRKNNRRVEFRIVEEAQPAPAK
jgi:outer membrane protein OmpA-like peptidoglycan-associated protein